MTTPLAPVTLTGAGVRLEPLSLGHLDALAEVGLDPELWAQSMARVRNRDELRRWIERALADGDAGVALPFVTIERASDRAVGSSRFGNYSAVDRRIEIGWTWVAAPWQRSSVNTEAKYLMLQHAFEALGCIRVELKTDALNLRSRNAILRIGATEEGILRSHAITEGGRVRDAVMFSVLAPEWPAVKQRLEAKLSR